MNTTHCPVNPISLGMIFVGTVLAECGGLSPLFQKTDVTGRYGSNESRAGLFGILGKCFWRLRVSTLVLCDRVDRRTGRTNRMHAQPCTAGHASHASVAEN